jgi:hypothetical protein
MQNTRKFTLYTNFPFKIIELNKGSWNYKNVNNFSSEIEAKIQRTKCLIDYYQKRGLHAERKLLKLWQKNLKSFKEDYPEFFI